MKSYLSLALVSLASQAFAGDSDWISPVYKDIFQKPLPFPPTKAPKYQYKNETTGAVVDYYEVEIKTFQQQVYPGLKPATLYGYDGISPGPTFRMERGREAVVRFINNGELATSVHLHGSYSRAPFDGWAEDTTNPGQYKDYYYPNSQSARTLWYHDHAVHHTAENAYFGLAGFYLLHDPAEDALNLPSGDYDLPLALNSKQYNKDGTLFSPASETVSLWGDVIHVNGQPWPYHKVEPRKYRLRFLDTAISRAFKLTFEDDAGKKIPVQVIASDAGLMTKPVQTDNLEISMAERWEVIIDFSAYSGKNITIKNARDVQADEDYNSTDKVMRFVVGTSVTNRDGNGDLPSTLRSVPFPPSKSGVDRTFKFERTNGEWRVNGVAFADVNNRVLAKPQRGAVEIWQLENSSGGWSHPVHIHLIDMQILTRTKGKRGVLNYEKEALKDVVLLGVNEVVTVIARYAPWDGVYMFHCHNLVHEDHDMMAAFNVSMLADFGYPETTHFIDPMEQRYRAKDQSSSANSESAVLARIGELYALDPYKDVDKVEAALIEYQKGGMRTTLSTAIRSSTAAVASSAAVTTKASSTAPAAATTTKATTTGKTSSTKTTSTKTTSTKATTTTKK
ncbi:Cupredoxin [Lentithecium fluviatile CBS 122367]|uniref:Cupredoxin n=1 Tax=Lentithecium fluviatile CBS 122367 TaxID=1168545 RepID=A0A6G1IXC0_9PLEO|nr:Cupredoxin [Lentithecium fluviatile CBS 122367]